MNIDIVVRVDCFDMAFIFYFLYLVHGASIFFFCWPLLALMEKGKLTRNYCHDNCDGCLLEVKHRSRLLLKKRAENPQGTRILLKWV